jgi:hypothetical protein
MDHAMLNRWVLKYVALLGQALRVHKRPVGLSWRMDETDVRIKGSWKYLYRSIRPAPQRPVAGDRRNVPGTAILFIGGINRTCPWMALAAQEICDGTRSRPTTGAGLTGSTLTSMLVTSIPGGYNRWVASYLHIGNDKKH